MCPFNNIQIQFVRFSVSSLVSVSQSTSLSFSLSLFSILGSSLLLSVMFSLSKLGDLTHFRDKIVKNEVYFVTEDNFIKAHGFILSARSDRIKEILENSENIPAVEFSDDLAALNSCLHLIYGGSVEIGEDNFKNIFKFGKSFEIHEMMDGVLEWIKNDINVDKFWQYYLELKSLNADTSSFVDAVKTYVSKGHDFSKCTMDLVRRQDGNKTTAIVELLSKIYDRKILSIILEITNITCTSSECLSSSSLTDNKGYLQTVIPQIVVCIDRYVEIRTLTEADKFPCIKALKKLSVPCSDVETLKSITALIADISTKQVPRSPRGFNVSNFRSQGVQRRVGGIGDNGDDGRQSLRIGTTCHDWGNIDGSNWQ